MSDYDEKMNAARHWNDSALAAFIVRQCPQLRPEHADRLARLISQGPLADVWLDGVSVGRKRQQHTIAAATRERKRRR